MIYFRNTLKNLLFFTLVCVFTLNASDMHMLEESSSSISAEYKEFLELVRQKGAQKALFHWPLYANNPIICSEDTLNFLIAEGAQINSPYDQNFCRELDEPIRSNQSSNALAVACAIGNKFVVGLLLLHGAHFRPSLLVGVKCGQAEIEAWILEYLINKGISVSCIEQSFSHACLYGHKNMVDIILKNHIINFNNDDYNNDQFISACIGGNADIVRTLLDHGFSIDCQCRYSGLNALEAACLWAQKDVIELLLKREILNKINGSKALSVLFFGDRCKDDPGMLSYLSYEIPTFAQQVEIAHMLIDYGVVPTSSQKLILWLYENAKLAMGLTIGAFGLAGLLTWALRKK